MNPKNEGLYDESIRMAIMILKIDSNIKHEVEVVMTSVKSPRPHRGPALTRPWGAA